jgi:hypothetical protein
VFGFVGMLSLGNAAPSLAGTLSLENSGATLTYVAAPGEVNNVTIDLTAGNYVVADGPPATVTAGAGTAACTFTANQATCPDAGLTAIRIDLGNGADIAKVTAPTPGVIVVRDAAGDDDVTCVAGQTAAADVADTVTGCASDLPPVASITSGPSGKTSDSSPMFGFSAADAVGFECRFDADAFVPCSSPSGPALPLGDGPHAFEVRAIDGFGPGDPVNQGFVVDTTAPETAIDSGPPSTTDSTSATISFLSPDSDAVAFECSLDGGVWRTCTSPASYAGLAEGSHTFGVRAVDGAGNRDATAAAISFRIVPGSSITIPPRLIITRPPASFVLIAGRTITISRKRIATISLNCSGNKDCAGDLTLVTSRRIKVSRKRRRYLQLGATSFFIPAPRTVAVKVPITRKKFRIVKRHRRLKTVVVVTDRDRAGRTRVSTREVLLRAR